MYPYARSLMDHFLQIKSFGGRLHRLRRFPRVFLALAVAALAGLASPAAQEAQAQVQGGSCNAFSGAYPLGTSYSDAAVVVPTCGPRPMDGGSTAWVSAYPGAIRTPGYQCVEFSERYLHYKYGAASQSANGAQVVDAYARAYPSLFVKFANATVNHAPEQGDVLSFSHSSAFNDTGHTAVVSASTVDANGNGQIWVEEQNASDNHGNNVMTVSNWYVHPEFGFPYVKWLHHPSPPPPPRPFVRAEAIAPGTPHGPAGYVMDDFGSLHSVGAAPDAGNQAGHQWPDWDIARDVAVRSDGSSGYVLDGYGGVHPFGGAPGVAISVYWRGWDIARRLTLRANGSSGYVLDGYGGLHPFGGAPGVAVSAYWRGWDIARDVAVRPDGSSGYVLDGWGGVHPFGGAPSVAVSAYWRGWDIARGVALRPDGSSGYVLDGYGGVHPFGGAPAVSLTAYYSGHDIARAISLTSSGNGGWVAFANGQVAPFGDASPIANQWRAP